MAVFHNLDESRTHLVKIPSRYLLVKKRLKQGKTREEQAYLRRTPQIEEFAKDGYIRRVKKRYFHFHESVRLIDFSKFHPVETPFFIECPSGRYRMDTLTVISNGRVASLAVLEGTTVGMSIEGMANIMARQQWTAEHHRKRNQILKLIAQHLGMSKQDLCEELEVPCVKGLGTVVGSGPYYSFCPFPSQKPILVRNGMSIKEILQQIL